MFKCNKKKEDRDFFEIFRLEQITPKNTFRNRFICFWVIKFFVGFDCEFTYDRFEMFGHINL